MNALNKTVFWVTENPSTTLNNLGTISENHPYTVLTVYHLYFNNLSFIVLVTP